MKALVEIQRKLKAPKDLNNTFGGYKYRSCESILEAVKPLLGTATLTISDDMVAIGERVYVKATATLKDGDESISVSAFAREAESKKGMDEAQITGAASSYARKYALNGLFCIDDTKDPDTQDNTDSGTPSKKAPRKKPSDELPPTTATNGATLVKEPGGDALKYLKEINAAIGYVRILAQRQGQTEEDIIRAASRKTHNGRTFEATCLEATVTKHGGEWLHETINNLKAEMGGK